MSTDTTHVIEGLRTRVRVRGEGSPLLLIGGLWSQLPMWDDVLPHLRGYRIIAFDPPGIGGTDMPKWPYSVHALARFATRVLDQVGVQRADVMGVSLGGAVAQQLARSFPDRVDRLVLVSTGPGALSVPGKPSVLMRFARPQGYADLHELEQDAGRIFGGRLRQQPDLVHTWPLRPPADLRAWLYRLAGTAAWCSLPWLHQLRQPTLVVHGDDDPIVPVINARLIAHLIPDARLRVVIGGGHLVLLDTTTEVLQTINAFLNHNAS